jgi:class 3 adenylate cyclase
MRAAQEATAGRPLALKVGIHVGPCIAVAQNGVLDYFGSTVNLAARLVSLSSGADLIVSGDVLADPEVSRARAFGGGAERQRSEGLRGRAGLALAGASVMRRLELRKCRREARAGPRP